MRCGILTHGFFCEKVGFSFTISRLLSLQTEFSCWGIFLSLLSGPYIRLFTVSTRLLRDIKVALLVMTAVGTLVVIFLTLIHEVSFFVSYHLQHLLNAVVADSTPVRSLPSFHLIFSSLSNPHLFFFLSFFFLLH